MIAPAQDRDIRFQQFFSYPRRDAKAGRRVFTVGDHQVDLFLGDNVRQPIVNDLPSRRADDVSYKQYAHESFHTLKHKNGADRLAVES